MIKDEDMANAIARISLTGDGLLLYRWLQREVQRLGLTTDSGALWMLEGRRSLAHDLMARMQEGIDERASRNSADAPSSDAVAFSRPGPVAVTRTRGAGRRITDDTTVPGFDTHPDRAT